MMDEIYLSIGQTSNSRLFPGSANLNGLGNRSKGHVLEHITHIFHTPGELRIWRHYLEIIQFLVLFFQVAEGSAADSWSFEDENIPRSFEVIEILQIRILTM